MRDTPMHLGIAALVLALSAPAIAGSDIVKMSRSGICHDSESPYYAKTQRFTPYESLAQCIEAGGRLPKGVTVNRSDAKQAATTPHQRSIPRYDRDAFPHWSDHDGDCINTRHELLMRQSVSVVDTGRNKCTATRGRWNDPYTGKTFYNAIDLDVDHLVPLAWAWKHGAYQWSTEKRERFANDEANLFAVQASVNREKGAAGPLEWLPPSRAFHCQYVVRFERIAKSYDLKLSAAESAAMRQLRQRVCGK